MQATPTNINDYCMSLIMVIHAHRHNNICLVYDMFKECCLNCVSL